MNTVSVLEWLDATFDARRRKAVDRDFRIGPMFTLKSAMDSGQTMHVCPATTTTP